MLHKAIGIEAEIKKDAGIGHELTMYVSTFNDVDAVKERVISGAFKKTIHEGFNIPTKAGKHSRIKTCWQHLSACPMGVPTHMEEDSKGLLTVSRITKTRDNEDRLALIEDGVVDTASIGYDTIKAMLAKDIEGVLDLKELKLYEYSPVTFACNVNAEIIGLKNFRLIRDGIHKNGGNAEDIDFLLSMLRQLKTINIDDLDIDEEDNKTDKFNLLTDTMLKTNTLLESLLLKVKPNDTLPLGSMPINSNDVALIEASISNFKSIIGKG